MTKRERPKKVEKTMEFMYLDPRVLKDNPNNYNTHPDSQIVTLANSMVALGFNKPVVVDENFVILAGHGAVLSAIYNQENGRVFESEGQH